MKTPSAPADPSSRAHKAESNQMRDRDRPAHGWYRFILSFPPHLVRNYIHRFGLTHHHHLLDPFCGTGTTVVEAKKLGIPSIGVEANPMAGFAGSVKIDWSPDPSKFLRLAHQISQATARLIATPGESLKPLSEAQQQLLLGNSISPLPLHKTLILLEHINRHPSRPYRQHYKLALAKALTPAISNLRFGPEVGLGKPKLDAPVVEAWWQEVTQMAEDLAILQTLNDTPAQIHTADARQLLGVIAPHSIDAVITSPPYPNEKDYTRTTRLESVLLGFLNSKADLRRLKEGLLRSNSRNVYTADQDDRWVAKHPEIQRLAADIAARRIALGKTSGFTRLYPRAVKLYFGGMAKHLADLRTLLRPGAQLAYVVGDQKSYLQVMIRTGELLADIAQGLGYEVVGIDLFRTRLSSVTQEQMREEVVLLRWPGELPPNPYPFSEEPL